MSRESKPIDTETASLAGARPLDLVWAVVIGCVGAFSSIAFRESTRGVHWLLTGHATNLTKTASLLSPAHRVIVPVVGGLAAGLVLYLGMHLHGRQTVKDYMEAVRTGDGRLGVRVTLIKCLSSLFTIASGGAIGREGPLVQLAALLGSLPGRWLEMPVERKRLLLACGAAAGIASAYNAPIAATLFIAEIVLGSIATRSIGPILIASMASTTITRAVVGDDPLFARQVFANRSGIDLMVYAILGIAAGLLAPVFLWLLRSSERFFKSLPMPAYAKMAVGGLLVGLLSLADTRVWGNGYSAVFSLLHESWLPSAILLLLVLKIAAVCATAGSGAVGGVFTPTLFIGASVGALVGSITVTLTHGQAASAPAYAMVGMGAFLCGTTLAPLMSIMMIFEMTLDYEMVLPLMLSCVLAFAVSTLCRVKSIYSHT